MTLDELIRKVPSGWRETAYVDLARYGDGAWTARFQLVEVARAGTDLVIEQPVFQSKEAENAMLYLVCWLRNKSIRRQGTRGPWVDVPMDLEAPEI